MLETELTALFQQQAGRDLAPPAISIPAASRAGRSRMLRRRIGVVATPVCAAAAVLAIALSSTVLAGAGPGPSGAPGAAPRSFSLLRPYAWFGWLPAGVPTEVAAELQPYFQVLDSSSNTQDVSLTIAAAGTCSVTSSAVTCAHVPFGHSGRRVGDIHGHPAYWRAPGKPFEREPLSQKDGSLTWEYAKGGWVFVDAPSLQSARRIAAEVRIGPAAGPTVRFPFRLTGTAWPWKEASVATAWWHGVLYAISDTTAVDIYPPAGILAIPAASPEPSNEYVPFDTGWSKCPAPEPGVKVSHQVIDGYQVLVASFTVPGGFNDKATWLCARNADGLSLSITTHAPAMSAARLFAEHVRLLGPDAANWTTRPIG